MCGKCQSTNSSSRQIMATFTRSKQWFANDLPAAGSKLGIYSGSLHRVMMVCRNISYNNQIEETENDLASRSVSRVLANFKSEVNVTDIALNKETKETWTEKANDFPQKDDSEIPSEAITVTSIRPSPVIMTLKKPSKNKNMRCPR